MLRLHTGHLELDSCAMPEALEGRFVHAGQCDHAVSSSQSDMGMITAKLTTCPVTLPSVPLRSQPYARRCAGTETGDGNSL